MQIFIEAIDLNIWEAIEIGPYIPTMVVGKALYTKQQTHDKMQKGQTFWLEIPSYLQTKPKTNNKQRFL